MDVVFKMLKNEQNAQEILLSDTMYYKSLSFPWQLIELIAV